MRLREGAARVPARPVTRARAGESASFFSNFFNLVSFAMFVTYLAAVTTRVAYFFLPSRDNFDILTPRFVDLTTLSYVYSLSFDLDSLVVLLGFLKLVDILRVGGTWQVMWDTVVVVSGRRQLGRALPDPSLHTRTPPHAIPALQATRNAIYFSFLFLVVFCGFVFFAWQVFGPEVEAYATFLRAGRSLMMMVLGSLNYEEIRDAAPNTAPLVRALHAPRRAARRPAHPRTAVHDRVHVRHVPRLQVRAPRARPRASAHASARHRNVFIPICNDAYQQMFTIYRRTWKYDNSVVRPAPRARSAAAAASRARGCSGRSAAFWAPSCRLWRRPRPCSTTAAPRSRRCSSSAWRRWRRRSRRRWRRSWSGSRCPRRRWRSE